LPIASGRQGQLGLNDRHRHDIEDTAGVGVFVVGQFFMTSVGVVGRLDLAIDLAAIGALQI